MNANKSDKQIQAAKQKALNDRKKAAAAKRGNKKPTKAAALKKPRKNNQWEDDEDDDYLDNDDDFVMSEDEPELNEAEFQSEDEDSNDSDSDDMVLADDDDFSDNGEDEITDLTGGSKSRQERAAARMTTGRRSNRNASNRSAMSSAAANDDADSDGDSSEDEGFLKSHNSGPLRKSAPSKLLQQKRNAAKANRLQALDASTAMKPSANKKKRRSSLTGSDTLASVQPALKRQYQKQQNPDTSDSDDELTSPEASKKPKANGSKDDPLELYGTDSSGDGHTPKKPTTKSKYFKSTTPPPPSNQNGVIDLQNSDDDTEASGMMDTPDQPQMRKKNHQKVHRGAFGEEDSDSDEDIIPQIKSNPSTQDNSEVLMDSDEDEDMQAAMKLSLKQIKKDSRAKQGKLEAETEEPEIENLIDSSEDDGDDGDDQGDDDYDEEREAASSVLKTAEHLSAQVVNTMSSWFGKNDASGNGSQGSQGSAIQGIIVDGAVSLGNLMVDKVSQKRSGADYEWISQDEMRQACPDVKLSDYQLVGVNWMRLLHGMKCTVGKKATNVNGVLADEMGLGKTVQTICFLASLAYSRRLDDASRERDFVPKPHLIVVPVSTLPNWVREFERFSPGTRVLCYYGSQDEREELNHRLREYHPDRLAAGKRPAQGMDVVVAPVTYFQNEKSPDRKLLSRIDYEYLVIDEAHSLKNAKSIRYKMLDKVKSSHRLLLTGTPVQNNPQELLNMLSFIMPLFSRKTKSMDDEDDKDSYTEQMLKYFVDETLEEGDDHERAYAKLKQLFAPFVLRRKKDEVISQLLPPKERKTEFVTLSDSARKIYDSIIEKHVNKNGSKLTAAIGDHLFTNLRKAAHHPLMLRSRHTSREEIDHLTDCFYRYGAFQGEGCTKERIAEELRSFSDFHIHLTALELLDANPRRREDLQRYVLGETDLFMSAKFVRLQELLPGLIADGHRILVFSSWTSCLDLLGCLMDYLKLKYQRMDGSIASAQRQILIDQFNTDDSCKVFLLSTKACGLGINLTSADTCIIHDLDFNPFNDLQAEDRCHRIGQTKKVTVYKLVASDTVDADIYKMQERKAKMNAAIMESNSSKNAKEKKELLESALSRYISSSPQPKKQSQTKPSSNKENEEEKEVVL
ncbi:MAG: hypothetical protein SGILL_003192 [Bacillariaceae sp.]